VVGSSRRWRPDVPMMCDVMPSIAETGREADLRDSVCSDIDEEHDYDESGGHGDDGLLLDEKEELVESLREAQDNLVSTQASLQRLERERESLYARLFTNQPIVRAAFIRPNNHTRPTHWLCFFYHDGDSLASYYWDNSTVCRQTYSRSVKSRTGQLTEKSDLK